MPNRLSHSAASKFMECPTAYKYHYIDRYRSKTTTGALLFGSALDHALTAMFKDKEKKPEEVFGYFWRFQEINGQSIYLPDSPIVVYANSDFDADLLAAEDIEKVRTKYHLEDPIKFMDQLYEEKDKYGFDKFEIEKKVIFNHMNWLCLFRKGLLMIDHVKQEILPNIVEVYGVQEFVSLENKEGDKIIGYADLICKWKGIDEPVVIDFKTSSRRYEDDSVLLSPQLTLYVHALSEKYKTRKAGFIVLNKQVIKNKIKICKKCESDGSGRRHKTCDAIVDGERCHGEWTETINPKIYSQILIDDIPARTEEIVMDNLDYINQSLTNGVFHRNLGSCVKPWGKCPFFNKCFHDKDDDLIKLEK